MSEKYHCVRWKQYTNIFGLPNEISVEINDSSIENSIIFDIKRHEELYYLGNDDKDNPVRGKQSKSEVEAAIEGILEKKEWNRRDVFRILAWKIGKIKHEESFNDKEHTEFCYHKGCSKDDAKILELQLPSSDILKGDDFNFLANTVIKLHDEYLRGKDSEMVWEELVAFARNEKYRGLGTVYLITLLYFITNRAKPIFDRFAMAALVVRKLESHGVKIQKGSVVRGVKLPEKNSNKIDNLLSEDKVYTCYCDLLDEYYPNGEWKNRKVDRALWVYGHYFKVPN